MLSHQEIRLRPPLIETDWVKRHSYRNREELLAHNFAALVFEMDQHHLIQVWRL